MTIDKNKVEELVGKPANDPLSSFRAKSNFLVESGLKVSSIPELLINLRKIDDYLKLIANLQRSVAEDRKRLSFHIQSLRIETPKGRPQEGSELIRNGKTYTFIDGAYYEIVTNPEVEKTTKDKE